MKVQTLALLLCICVILHLFLASASTADESQEAPEQLIKDAQNPITDRSSVPILNSTGFGAGPFDRTSNVTLIEPVLPISLGKNYLVLRPIVSLVYRPMLNQSSGGEFGLGDSTLQMYFVPEPNERVTWGLGLTSLLPTASDSSLGTGKWGIGPAFAAIWVPGRWTVGGRMNYYRSIAGDASRADVSLLTIQPVLSYILRDGLYLTSGPIMTANMEITRGEKWLLPVGGGIGKVFGLWGQRMNLSLQSYWNALHPETAGEWSLVIQLQSLFPRVRF